MEFQGFMLANYAEVNRGLLYVQGGGWEFATAEEVPGVIQPFVAGFITGTPDSFPDSIVLEVALETAGGATTAVGSTFISMSRTEPIAGEVWSQAVAFAMPLPIRECGRNAVLFSADGASVRVPLFVRTPPNT